MTISEYPRDGGRRRARESAMRRNKWIYSLIIVGCVAAIGPVQANAASSSEIMAQINAYMADLEASQQKSEELEAEIAEKQEEVGELYAEVTELGIEKNLYQEEMKTRIVYFYEETRGNTLLTSLLGANSFADFLNRLQFQQSLYDYDAAQLAEYQALVDDLEEKEDVLDAEIEDLGDMVEEQAVLQATLNATIASKQGEYDAAKAAEAAAAAAAAEAERRAQEDTVEYAMASASTAKTTTSSKSTASTSTSSSSSGSYNYPDLYYKGVIYYNGHKETWYSQRVLPGNGLSIPGRHVDSRGLVCDGDGYVCVASYDYSKGTVVQTSVGAGKVYDWCATPGVIDIYTDW